MNKKEACEALGISNYDTALPQSFFNDMLEVVEEEENPLSHFVWSYDRDNFGEPRPLTDKGLKLLKKYNEVYGTSWRTDHEILHI